MTDTIGVPCKMFNVLSLCLEREGKKRSKVQRNKKKERKEWKRKGRKEGRSGRSESREPVMFTNVRACALVCARVRAYVWLSVCITMYESAISSVLEYYIYGMVDIGGAS